MLLFSIGLGLFCSGPVVLLGGALAFHFRVVQRYVPYIVRIFQEKPLFIVPRAQPTGDGEAVSFQTSDGLTLRGCYFPSPAPRRGVILFGLEFGSNCWSCRLYCEQLIAAGFDVFAYEPRNQGDSDRQEGYDPLHWVTDYEVSDARAALAYLKARPGAASQGVGFFGISKGAGAVVLAAADDPAVRCFVTDGMFATFGTLMPYMRQYFKIYNTYFPLELVPDWYLGHIARLGLGRIQRQRGCHFPSLERAMGRLRTRPLLMIHGEQDSYIKPEMARALFARGHGPREFWLVPGAKHNQALQVAEEEYRRRVLRFFEEHLAGGAPAPSAEQPAPTRSGLNTRSA